MWLLLEITINSNLFVVACGPHDVEILVSYLKTATQPSGISGGAVLSMGWVLEISV